MPSVGAVGWPEIDALHVEFEQCLALLVAAGDSGLDRAFDELEAHLQSHFGTEERLMRECAFPVMACHKHEHDRVFEVLAEVRRRRAEGDREIAPRLIAELPRWFEVHAGTMDTALAEFLKATQAARAAA